MDSNFNPIPFKQTKCSECPIRRLALFKGVREEDLIWTQNFRSDQFKVKAKKALYKQNEHPNYMFTLYHGWLLQYKTLDNGKRQVLRIALPGDLIGFQADFNGPMEHSTIALNDSVLCAFPRPDIKEMFNKNTGLSARLGEMHARDMSICQNHLIGIGQKSAEERIAYLSLELLFRLRQIYSDNAITDIEFPLTQEDLGDAVGLTQIHVNRTIKSLRERNLMEIKGKRLYIHDIEGLKTLGSFDEKVLQTYTLF